MKPQIQIPLRSAQILMVEDNPADVYLIKKALEHSRFSINLGVANDGLEALDYLHHQGRFSQVLKPDLILLDLSLPKKNGWMVMEEIKLDSQLNSILVVILTGSTDGSDTLKARQLKAELFVVKPFNVHHLSLMVTCVDRLLQNRFFA